MIERDRDVYVLACDNCGEEILGFQSCEQAQDYMIENNWISCAGETLNPENGVVNYCPRCTK